MKNSVLGLPQQKPREKKKALRGTKRRDETKLAVANELLTLILRTTKARSKGGVREDVRRKFRDLARKRSHMVDRKEESAKKSPLAESSSGKSR